MVVVSLALHIKRLIKKALFEKALFSILVDLFVVAVHTAV